MEEHSKLELNELAIESLRVSAKWSTFLAIIGFIGLGFMLLAALLVGAAFSSMPDNHAFGSINPFGAFIKFLPLFYILIAVIYYFPVYYLFKYASEMKKALNFRSSAMVAEALTYLKSHHKFLGIMTIVIISLYIIGMIAGVLFAVSMASTVI